MVAGNTWMADLCPFTCTGTLRHTLPNQMPCRPGQAPRTCPNKHAKHSNMPNAPCLARQAKPTNATGAALQKMEPAHARNWTRDSAGWVGPHQYNPPLILAQRMHRSQPLCNSCQVHSHLFTQTPIPTRISSRYALLAYPKPNPHSIGMHGSFTFRTTQTGAL